MAKHVHDDYITHVVNGKDAQGQPWVTTHWKCRECGRTWTETHGPGA